MTTRLYRFRSLISTTPSEFKDSVGEGTVDEDADPFDEDVVDRVGEDLFL
jgi:hypothetical protein